MAASLLIWGQVCWQGILPRSSQLSSLDVMHISYRQRAADFLHADSLGRAGTLWQIVLTTIGILMNFDQTMCYIEGDHQEAVGITMPTFLKSETSTCLRAGGR